MGERNIEKIMPLDGMVEKAATGHLFEDHQDNEDNDKELDGFHEVDLEEENRENRREVGEEDAE